MMIGKIINKFRKKQRENDNNVVAKEYKITQCKDDYSRLIALYEKPEYMTQNVFKLNGLKFGVEIEFNSDKTEMEIIEYFKRKGYLSNSTIVNSTNRTDERDYKNWIFCRECSSNEDSSKKCEKELISPIFTDDPKTWIQIKEVLTSIKNDLNGEVNDVCSLHIHIDRKCFMKSPAYFNGLHELYVFLEPLILCVAAGDNRAISPTRLFHYSAVASHEELFRCKGATVDEERGMIETAQDFDKATNSLINTFQASRYHSINYSTKSTEFSTVEFRVFNGTLNENIVQTYLILIDHILTNIGVTFEKTEPYYCKEGVYYLDSNYVEKCFSLLNLNTREKSAILDILVRNNFFIPKYAIRALEGRYTQEEINRVIY